MDHVEFLCMYDDADRLTVAYAHTCLLAQLYKVDDLLYDIRA